MNDVALIDLSTATFDVPAGTRTDTFAIVPGQPLFILGQNGTGKSALVHWIANDLTRDHQVLYIPGTRPNYFDNEGMSLTPAAWRHLLTNLASWDRSPDTRWRPISGTARNEKAIYNLNSCEVDYKVEAANDIAQLGAASSSITKLTARDSPLDRLNRILRQGNLPVQMRVANAELVACRADAQYSIAKMSDGERAALIMAAEVMSAPDGSIFLIDEPEPHLHKSIFVPLLASLIRERPECGFVISTHELSLPEEIANSRVLMVRGCTWTNDDIASWDIDLLPPASAIPEDLMGDVLGSRRKILFVEGTSVSLDQPLYALLFPNVSVRAREGCREVRRAVTGLRSVAGLHRVEAFGLIDNDGLSAVEIADLEGDCVYALPIFSVESIYYSRPVRAAVAAHQAASFGVDAAQTLVSADQSALAELQKRQAMKSLAAQISMTSMRQKLLAAAPDKRTLMSAGAADVSVSIASPFPTELQTLQDLVADGRLDDIISRYPVRDSGAFAALARGLHLVSREDYEQAALVRLGADAALAQEVREMLGTLAARLV